jgi:HTH-type transcriptional regulator/antitoxin HigA
VYRGHTMMNEKMILNKFKEFTHVAFPILSIKGVEAYEDALNMVEHLMESVGEDDAPTENLLISLLHQAIQRFEDKNEELIVFEKESIEVGSDVAVLRVLLDQYHLTLSDLPEIGHKSLVSKILSGDRSLTKTHIKKLSQRFNIDPSLFF